ncbi:MAG TPA: GNAT family N-acetyltransferase [Candidatus Hydrogenedentes bacterium]|nr:GNAT family N-acetyltransferase [Candidatus Hydrogenedentota bacterium]
MATPVPKIEMTVTYFEMRDPLVRRRMRPAPKGLELVHVPEPPVHFYRYLQDTIGDGMWFERRYADDEAMRAAIHKPGVALWIPYLHGAPAGMVELDCEFFPEVELVFFGVMPEHIGKGLGGYLLDWAVDKVFAEGATRFWLHTCNYDHPNAIPAYKAAGFEVYDTRTALIDDPHALGLL